MIISEIIPISFFCTLTPDIASHGYVIKTFNDILRYTRCLFGVDNCNCRWSDGWLCCGSYRYLIMTSCLVVTVYKILQQNGYQILNLVSVVVNFTWTKNNAVGLILTKPSCFIYTNQITVFIEKTRPKGLMGIIVLIGLNMVIRIQYLVR